MQKKTTLEQLRSYVIALRREFHAHPEISGEEIWTSARIAQELDVLGVPYIVDQKRNVIGKINGAKGGKRIALRADIDALPITEQTGLSFASEIEGAMHACGHDGHIAGVLGAARILLSLRSTWNGTVYLCFQMGEEINSGAEEILAYLEQEGGVDIVVGTHVIPGIATGTFAFLEGSAMAGMAVWTLTVNGKGGHGSQPWNAADPIRPACDIVSHITGLVGNRFNIFDPFVVSPCTIHAGSADNIIPDSVKITGTLRFFKEETLTQLTDVISYIANHIAAAHGTTASFEVKSSCRPVVNDPDIIRMAKAVAQTMGVNVMTIHDPLIVSDNISEYLAKYKGLYYFSGTTKPGTPPANIHTATYDIDEEVICDNARFLGAFAYDYLSEKLK